MVESKAFGVGWFLESKNPFKITLFLRCLFDHVSVVVSCQADAPNTGLIPESDAVGVTVVLITCTYRGQEFIRIGYYVNNEYTDPELRENPPIKPDYTQVRHTTHFACQFFGILVSEDSAYCILAEKVL